MNFAEQLKSQRQRLGLTQSEAADLLEVSASWVDKAEREIRTPIKITQEGAIARLTKSKRRTQGTNAKLSREECEKRVTQWEEELSKVMPADFKDWWQNAKSEWPLVARLVIESLRKRDRLGPLSPLEVG